MSSPANGRGRQTRGSASTTPRSTRSSQNPPTSSPTPQSGNFQATPRAARRLREEGAPPSSSPMFFRSSPSRGQHSSADTPDVRMDEPSSPVRADEGDMTPRGNSTAIRGIYIYIHIYLPKLWCCVPITNIIVQTLPQFDTCPAPVQHAHTTASAPIFPAAAAGFLFLRGLLRVANEPNPVEMILTPVDLVVLPQAADGGFLLMVTGCLLMMASLNPMQLFRMSTRIRQRRRHWGAVRLE